MKQYFHAYNTSYVLIFVLILIENEWFFYFGVGKLLGKVILRNVCIALYSSNHHVSCMDRELMCYH